MCQHPGSVTAVGQGRLQAGPAQSLLPLPIPRSLSGPARVLSNQANSSLAPSGGHFKDFTNFVHLRAE